MSQQSISQQWPSRCRPSSPSSPTTSGPLLSGRSVQLRSSTGPIAAGFSRPDRQPQRFFLIFLNRRSRTENGRHGNPIVWRRTSSWKRRTRSVAQSGYYRSAYRWRMHPRLARLVGHPHAEERSGKQQRRADGKQLHGSYQPERFPDPQRLG